MTSVKLDLVMCLTLWVLMHHVGQFAVLHCVLKACIPEVWRGSSYD